MEEIINEYYAERKGNYIYVDRDDGQSGDEQGTDERHLNEYEQSEKGMYDSNVDGDEVEGHKNRRIRDNGSQIDGGSGRSVKNIFSLSEPIEEKDNAKYLLKLYVEEALPNKGGEAFSRAYELKDIKEIVTIPDGVLSENGGLTDDTMTISIDSISALFDIVKTYDKDFNPKPANPLFLNKNGTPKVMYHQTSKGFTVFNTNNERAGKNDSETHTGMFFKPNDNDIIIMMIWLPAR